MKLLLMSIDGVDQWHMLEKGILLLKHLSSLEWGVVFPFYYGGIFTGVIKCLVTISKVYDYRFWKEF